MSDTPALNDPAHTIGQIAKAGGVSLNTIRQWFKRGILSTGTMNVSEPDSHGMARLFNGHTALHIAIMGRLIRLGIAPALASAAGLGFAHEGGTGRLPGHLFPRGRTFVIVGENCWDVLNLSDADTIAEIWEKLPAAARLAEPFVFLPLDHLVDVVRVTLGLDRDPRVSPKKARR